MKKVPFIKFPDDKVVVFGTYFKTKEMADSYVRQKRRQFKNGFFVVTTKDAFVVLNEKQFKN